MAVDAAKFPQLAKMDDVQAQSQIIGEFLDWLSSQSLTICKPEGGLRGERFFPIMETTEQLLARHYGIDLNAVERERRQILADFNQRQGG